MRLILGCVLAVLYANGGAPGAEPLDELFSGWATAHVRAESLVVEFGLETNDSMINKREKASGTFRLIRSKKGEVFASYEVVAESPEGKKGERFSGLLNGGKVYWLDQEKKTALRFEPAGEELSQFLEKYLNLCVVLLDRKRAEAKCQVEVVKQDKWYTYLAVKSKQVKRYGWFSDNFHDGRVALMRMDSEAVPKGMPRQLWHTNGLQEYLFDIKAWRLNPHDGPKLEEFARPEDRPGWKVENAPFQGKK